MEDKNETLYNKQLTSKFKTKIDNIVDTKNLENEKEDILKFIKKYETDPKFKNDIKIKKAL